MRGGGEAGCDEGLEPEWEWEGVEGESDFFLDTSRVVPPNAANSSTSFLMLGPNSESRDAFPGGDPGELALTSASWTRSRSFSKIGYEQAR